MKAKTSQMLAVPLLVLSGLLMAQSGFAQGTPADVGGLDVVEARGHL